MKADVYVSVAVAASSTQMHRFRLLKTIAIVAVVELMSQRPLGTLKDVADILGGLLYPYVERAKQSSLSKHSWNWAHDLCVVVP